MESVVILVGVVGYFVYDKFFKFQRPIDVEYELIPAEEAEQIYKKIINGEIEVYES